MENLRLSTVIVLLSLCLCVSVKADAINPQTVQPFNLQFSVTPQPCSGSSIDLTVEGGTAPYTFLWSNGETTEDLLNVNPSLYTVLVTDNTGLQHLGEVIVEGDSVFALQVFVNDVTCPRARDGSAKVVPSGGTPPYSYQWSNGVTSNEITRQNGGIFSVTVTDAMGCSKTTQVTISSPSRFSFTVEQKDVTCPGGDDGYVNVVATGGSAPYQYLWSTGDTVPVLNNLSPGTYMLTLTDRRNCEVTIDAFVFSPDSFSVNATTAISCEGGSVDLTVSGGSPPYSYQWSNGAQTEDLQQLLTGIYTVEVIDSKSCRTKPFSVHVENYVSFNYQVDVRDISCTGMGDGYINLEILQGQSPFAIQWSNGDAGELTVGLSAGAYSAVVTDGNGCVHEIPSQVVAEPAPLFSDVVVVENESGGASVDLMVSGGSAPYQYAWSDSITTEDRTGLSPGRYFVSIRDNLGCLTEDTAFVNGYPMLTISVSDVKCFGGNDGRASAEVFQGTPPYSFAWSTGAISSVVSDLSAGEYTVIVTDSRGLSKSGTITVNEPMELLLNLEASDVTCFGESNGSIYATAAGGLPPYSFNWSEGSTSSSVTDLAPGNYTISVLDKNGCSVSDSYEISQPEKLELATSVNGANVNLSVKGGTSPYYYLWSNGATTEDLTNVANGVYTVEVNDVNHCFASQMVTVNVAPAVPVASIDCCTDTYVASGTMVSIPVNFSEAGPFVLKYKEIYDHKSFVVKTVTATANPYIIKSILTSTTTFELVSVSKNNVTGKVCGRATVGINNFAGNCSRNCFRADVISETDSANCKTYHLEISNDGNCRFALSHLSISVPCGTIQSVWNSNGYKVEYGMDPKTEIIGFKLDNISDFGENKNGMRESFLLSYTICMNNTLCALPVCEPLVAFKAGQCIFYGKASFDIAGKLGVENYSDEEINFNAEAQLFPNPVSQGESFKIILPRVEERSSVNVRITDQYGKQVYNAVMSVENSESELSFPGLTSVTSGLYIVVVEDGSRRYIVKLQVK